MSSTLYPGGDNPVSPNLGLALYDMSFELAENMLIIDAAISAGGGAAFSAITSGVNIAANMVVGSGAKLSASGTGTIIGTGLAAAGNTEVLNSTGITITDLFGNSITLAQPTGTNSLQLRTVQGAGVTILSNGSASVAIIGDAAGNDLQLGGGVDNFNLSNTSSGASIVNPAGGNIVNITGSTINLLDGLGDQITVGPAVNNIVIETNSAGYLLLNPSGFQFNDGNSTTIFSTGGLVTLANTKLNGSIADGTASTGSAGQVLSSTVSGTLWVSAATGSVTSFSAGNLNPLFTTSVATPTSTPALTFSLTTQASGTVFSNSTAGTAVPSFTTNLVLGNNAPSGGSIHLFSISGGSMGIIPGASASSFNSTLPITTGTLANSLTGDGTLFSTVSANVSGALVLTKVNAGGGTVFGNNTTTAAAPIYTTAPVLGIPGTSNGTLALASSTASGLYTIATPANAATPTLTLPTTSNVLVGQLAGDNTIFATTLVPASAAGTLTLPTPKNQTANTIFAGPTSGGAAAPTFRALVNADIPSGTVLWNQIGNAAGALTLANGTNITTFNQTSAAFWTWANTTPTVTGAATTVALSAGVAPSNVSGNTWRYTLAATETGAGSNAWVGAIVTLSGYTGGATGNNGTNLPIVASTTTTVDITNATGSTTNTGTPVMISTGVTNSPVISLNGTINSGTAGTLSSIADTWTLQQVPGSVVPNPVSLLQILHTGSTGKNYVQVPNLQFGTTTNPQIDVNANGYTLQFSAQNGGTVAGSLQVGTGIGNFGLSCSNPNKNAFIMGNISTGLLSASICSVSIANAGNFTSTSGTQVGLSIGSLGGAGNPSAGATFTFIPSAAGSGSFVACQITPTINATVNGAQTGGYTALLINPTETTLGSGTNNLLDLQVASTSKFTINNKGVVTKAVGNTTTKNGIAATLFTSFKTAQTAAQAAVSLVASTPAVGLWRIAFVANITTAGTTSALGGSTGFQITFTNGNGDAVSKTSNPTTPTISAANTTGTSISGDLYCYAASASAITYSFGYTSTGTAMQYDLAVYAEYLG